MSEFLQISKIGETYKCNNIKCYYFLQLYKIFLGSFHHNCFSLYNIWLNSNANANKNK